jgi:hypothetical protein
MRLSPDEKVRAIRALTDALFQHVLYDEEPIFVADEATILDVSLAPPEELQRRCSTYYKTAVSLEDLRRPLWQLLPELEHRRQAAD